jgi:hypothetical protein
MNKNKKLSMINHNVNFFGNELNLNLIKNNNKIKLMNDKNNNNDEEDYENQYQTLRKDDQLDQNVINEI